MYGDRRQLSVATALEAVFDADDELRRPVPDLDHLATLDAGCRDARM